MNVDGLQGHLPDVLRFVVIVGLCLGCRDDPPINYPTTVSIDQSKLPLGVGDKITLTVFYGSRSLTAAYTIDTSGAISVQFIGDVPAGGRLVGDIQKEIQQRLADGWFENPIVSVNVAEINSLTLSVSGMVLKNGNVRYAPGLTITDVIAMSGGFSPLARKNMVRVKRIANGVEQTYKVPVERIREGDRPNFPMLPGDDVWVPERPW